MTFDQDESVLHACISNMPASCRGLRDRIMAGADVTLLSGMSMFLAGASLRSAASSTSCTPEAQEEKTMGRPRSRDREGGKNRVRWGDCTFPNEKETQCIDLHDAGPRHAGEARPPGPNEPQSPNGGASQRQVCTVSWRAFPLIFSPCYLQLI